jgi:hypothetical protein
MLWGAAFVAAGACIAASVIPGSESWATGPRIGIASVLLLLGFFMIVGPWIAFAVRRASAKEGGGGNCPVGTTCGCGHFNFKPRAMCKQCGKDMVYPA